MATRRVPVLIKKIGSPRGVKIRTFSLFFIFGLQNTRKNKRFLIFYQLKNEIVPISPRIGTGLLDLASTL